MAIRKSYTAVVERNQTWRGVFATEPYEAAWATEAIFFVRVLQGNTSIDPVRAFVQISPDGIHWCNEGTDIFLDSQSDAVSFCRVRHFGGWLRLAGELREGEELVVIAYLSLKE